MQTDCQGGRAAGVISSDLSGTWELVANSL